jgi:hypothetical protein
VTSCVIGYLVFLISLVRHCDADLVNVKREFLEHRRSKIGRIPARIGSVCSIMEEGLQLGSRFPIGLQGPRSHFAGPNVGKGSRLCEKAQEQTRRRIVFSIPLLPIAATAGFVFRLTKSRRTFYAQIERLCFHAAWVESRSSNIIPIAEGIVIPAVRAIRPRD